jgi:hypothetical protein
MIPREKEGKQSNSEPFDVSTRKSTMADWESISFRIFVTWKKPKCKHGESIQCLKPHRFTFKEEGCHSLLLRAISKLTVEMESSFRRP